MNFEHYHIYIVEGKSQLERVEQFNDARLKQTQNAIKWAESQGGKNPLHLNGRCVGFIAEPGAKLADGWKSSKSRRFQSNVYVPDRRTKIGKTRQQEMLSFKISGGADLATALGAPSKHAVNFTGAGVALLLTTAFQENDRTFVMVPKGEDAAPEIDGCRLLKLSEFYAFKEARPAAKGATR